MGKKNLLSSTAKKKPKAKKTAAKSKKGGVKAKAVKKAPAKKTPAKRKPAPKSAKQTNKAAKRAPKKVPSIKELLLAKYEVTPPASLYSPPDDTRRASITSPPYISNEAPEEIERIRKLLFKQFDLTSPEAAAPAVAEAPAPEPTPVAAAPAEVEAPVPEPTPVAAAPAEVEAPAPEPTPVAAAPAEVEAPAPEPTPVAAAPAEVEAPAPEPTPVAAAPAEVEAPAPEPTPVAAAPAEVEAPAPEPTPVAAAPAEVEAPAPEPTPVAAAPAVAPRKKISPSQVPKEKTLSLPEITISQPTEITVPDTVSVGQGDNSMQKSIVLAGACFAAILLLIVLASFSNTGNFEIKNNNGTVEIWKGKFAPIGTHKLMALEGISVSEERLGAASKKDAYALIFQNYLQKADKLLEASKLPDYEAIRTELNKAKSFAITTELMNIAKSRLHKIEMMTLLYKADISASKGTTEGFEAARQYLNEANRLFLDPVDENLVNQKIEWIDAKMKGSAAETTITAQPTPPPAAPTAPAHH